MNAKWPPDPDVVLADLSGLNGSKSVVQTHWWVEIPRSGISEQQQTVQPDDVVRLDDIRLDLEEDDRAADDDDLR